MVATIARPLFPRIRESNRRRVTAVGRVDKRLAVGQLRRQRRLDSEAVYRVRDWTDAFVEVEVVTAPGLQASEGFRFTREAVLAMDVVPPHEGPSASTDPRD
jgi:hypothetical protein